jgi:hypothetical protein
MKTREAQAIARCRRALLCARSTHEQTQALEILYETGLTKGLDAGIRAFKKVLPKSARIEGVRGIKQ